MDKIVFIGYALFMFVGAYFGWKKGSSVSLAAGLGSGLLMLLGIWLMSINPRGAYIFISCLTGVLSAVFVIRLVKTQSFMPSGMLLIITLAVLAFTLFRLPQQQS
ncbi:MAG: TMEM14 family protein [Candidatus Omnitrophica bacterium]|nr:TMEM14 family protein [Candidatus Omnitrophota bacterium]